MSDASVIALGFLGFLLIIFVVLIRVFPEELRRLLRRVESVEASSGKVGIKFFEEQAEKAAKIKGGDAPSAPDGDPLSGASILWVDDAPEKNFHEAAMFEALGADVRFARTNEKAIELAKENPPTLVVSDIARSSAPESGLEIPGAFTEAGLSAPPLVYYVGDKTGDHTPDGHVVTALPKDMFSAAIKAIETNRR